MEFDVFMLRRQLGGARHNIFAVASFLLAKNLLTCAATKKGAPGKEGIKNHFIYSLFSA